MHELWGTMPAGPGVQIWTKHDKRTSCFPEPSMAATYAVQQCESTDVYMAAGLAARVNAPVKKRALASAVAGIPGLWADIDVNGGPESKTGAAPSTDAALELASSLLEPTVIVNSGYGIQAWWLFEDGAWIFGFEAEREQAARLSAGFQAALRAAARDAGYGLDSTHDLARLMRMPGTFNHKGRHDEQFGLVPVTLLEAEGPRYTVESLGGRAQKHMGASAGEALRTLSGRGVDITLGDVNPPFERLEELREILPDFRKAWNHTRTPKTAEWSLSHWDMAIASYLVQANFANQEIADTLRYHRRKHSDPGGKADRLDYLQRTIAKARSAERFEEAEREATLEREDTADQMARLNEDGVAPPAVVVHLFNKILGGPAVKELVQNGRDPDLARFHLVLADGREVPIGPVSSLINQGRFRERFAVVTAHLPKLIKANRWDDVVQALLSAATIREEREDTKASLVIGWLDSYVDRRTSADKDGACQAHDPFVNGDELFIALGPFNQWLRKVQGERVASMDLKLQLEFAGFERRTVNYRRDDGSKSSRSYFAGPVDLVEAAPKAAAAA